MQYFSTLLRKTIIWQKTITNHLKSIRILYFFLYIWCGKGDTHKKSTLPELHRFLIYTAKPLLAVDKNKIYEIASSFVEKIIRYPLN